MGSQTEINVSIINKEQTSLQRTKQVTFFFSEISKCVKKAKLLNTVSVTFKWHEGTQNTAARLIWPSKQGFRFRKIISD